MRADHNKIRNESMRDVKSRTAAVRGEGEKLLGVADEPGILDVRAPHLAAEQHTAKLHGVFAEVIGNLLIKAPVGSTALTNSLSPGAGSETEGPDIGHQEATERGLLLDRIYNLKTTIEPLPVRSVLPVTALETPVGAKSGKGQVEAIYGSSKCTRVHR